MTFDSAFCTAFERRTLVRFCYTGAPHSGQTPLVLPVKL